VEVICGGQGVKQYVMALKKITCLFTIKTIYMGLIQTPALQNTTHLAWTMHLPQLSAQYCLRVLKAAAIERTSTGN